MKVNKVDRPSQPELETGTVVTVKPDRPASSGSRILSGRLTKQLQLVGQYRLQEDIAGLQ